MGDRFSEMWQLVTARIREALGVLWKRISESRITLSGTLAAFWSTALSLPFIAGGLYLYLVPAAAVQLPGASISSINTRNIGIPVFAFGAFVFVIGLYVHFVSPSKPVMRDDEDLIDTRTPSQRVAFSKIALGLPLLAIAGYMMFYTLIPYAYPTIVFVLGLYYLSSGIKTYWVNILTTYYITTRRVISEYRFVSLRRQEIPLNKVRGVEERKSVIEALVGLGNIRVASGGGGGSVRLKIRNIAESSAFANELRNLLD